MSFTEDWGTSGTAGVYGWTCSAGNPWAIGTYDGTVGIQGWNGGTGSIFINKMYEWSGGVTARVWGTADGGYGPKILLGSDVNGSTFSVRLGGHSNRGAWVLTKPNGNETSSEFAGGGGWANTWVRGAFTYSNGTFYGTVTSSEGTFTGNHSAWGFIREPFFYPEIGKPASADAGTNQIIDYITYDAEEYKTILDFVGTYNDGTSAGTVHLGPAVISMGGVSQVGYLPYVNQGFSSSVSVQIDDADGDWSGIVGNNSKPTYLEGEYLIRHQWNGSWYTLGHYFSRAEDITYDYGRKVASVNLQDTLSRYAETVFPMNDTTSANPVWRGTLGYVQSAGDGTVAVQIIAAADNIASEFYAGDMLWDAGGTACDHIKIGSAYHYDQYGCGSVIASGGNRYGTLGIDGDIPSWITAKVAGNDEIYITHSMPNKEDVLITTPSTWVSALVSEMGGTRSTARSEDDYMNYYAIGWGKRYYGGDKVKDALNDVCAGCMTSYTLDSSGNIQFFTDGPWTGSVYGTIDFNSAYNNNWSLSMVGATKQVIVNAAWDPVEERYNAEYISEEGTFDSGRVLEINAPWLRDGVEALALGDRVGFNRGLPRVALSFQVEGSRWLDYAARDRYVIDNLPAVIPVNGSFFRLMGKTYDLTSDLTMLTFESERPDRNWFRADISTTDGPDIVW